MLEVAVDGSFQFAGAAVDAAPNLFFGDGCEEPFDQIEPRGTGIDQATP